ncbi:phosphoribosylglycinamide formyltransferase [Ruminococcus sp.]|uniref:phosphoribosylglycinamide formyltransferase n=1 Tax=Ruminococcus sp. TaxID=41978 RepID=UPI0025D3B07B|nr:phosphoribosylglycinamide formyltransferase [Ruminococcus sp.]
MKNIVVLVSGGGTNLQALIDAQKQGMIPNGRITCVISSNPDAYALVRARENGIGTRVIVPKEFSSREIYTKALLEALFQEYADLIVLAGFMTILDEAVIHAYRNQIINVHPSLIPSFCGPGYYGLRVHEAALERGVKYTGATVHFVNEVADDGPIILQKPVAVQPGDTPETLQKRVMQEAEWVILPQAVSLFCNGRLEVKGKTVWIKG